MTGNLAISADGLRKSYGDKLVLDGIDLSIPAGSVFALLGPNGAGKTTTVQILSTLIPADGGQARVAGHDLATAPGEVRASIGVTGQFSAVDALITGEENMRLMADLHHLPKAEGRRVTAELLERFDLVEAAKKPASTYSGGMKRRLDIAMTLVGAPRIIFLDEPTTGLDPRSRHTMWGIVRELVCDGVTVFLTTQYLEEADELADRIAVLNGGRIVAEGSADELKRIVPGGHVRLRFTDPAVYASAATALGEVTRDDESLALQILSDGSQRELRSLLDRHGPRGRPRVSAWRVPVVTRRRHRAGMDRLDLLGEPDIPAPPLAGLLLGAAPAVVGGGGDGKLPKYALDSQVWMLIEERSHLGRVGSSCAAKNAVVRVTGPCMR